MLKVVNSTVPKNNAFHQNYLFTTFGVVFYHPFGLTVYSTMTTKEMNNAEVADDG